MILVFSTKSMYQNISWLISLLKHGQESECNKLPNVETIITTKLHNKPYVAAITLYTYIILCCAKNSW